LFPPFVCYCSCLITFTCFEDAATKTESQYLKCFYGSICSKNLKKCFHSSAIEAHIK
jgi:hypothetical protein